MTEIRKTKVNKKMPTFLIEFFDVSKEHMHNRGYDVSSKAASKRLRKHIFEGRVTHIQSKKSKWFHSVSQFHAFIEKYRLKN